MGAVRFSTYLQEFLSRRSHKPPFTGIALACDKPKKGGAPLSAPH
ncbi:hypothetical protein AB28_0163 [Raoultella ornithinolytica 2-156-04_S1_C2]|nr:hypothetical protein AB28_0163 [Raoultella ornithinolytica 2-156-04_S1_C2]